MIPRVAPKTRTRWRRRLRAAFTERLALKATALALALVLWFTVSVRENAEQVVNVRFLPAFEPGIALADQPPTIRALVRGSGRDILKLYSTPPAIRMDIGGDVGDSMTVVLRPSNVDLPPGVSAMVLDVQPRRVTLAFRRLGRADTTGRPASGGGWAVPAPVNPAPASDTVIRSVPVIVEPTPADSADTSDTFDTLDTSAYDPRADDAAVTDTLPGQP